jgi:SWI/SNF-related matrix-associated actin-dependent regulator of chromatin subfamily A member 5
VSLFLKVQVATQFSRREYLSAKVLGSTKHNMQNTAMSSLAASSSSASLGSTPLDASVASTPSDSQELLDPADDDHQADAVQSLGHDELLHILRGGSSALASTWAEDGKEDAAARFQKAPIEEILIRSRRLQNIQTARVERDVVGEVALTTDTAIELEAEEERLLQGREAVQTRLWQGRVHDKSKTNSEIRQDWERLEKRVRKERVVYIDGHPVSADSISSDVGWTAVPTITSDKAKLAQLAEPKRGRAKFEHQDFCLNCLDGGQVLQCR